MTLLEVASTVPPPVLAFMGGCLAFIGGWLTAKYQWRIEKQKMKVQHRRDLIATWRRELIPMITADGQQLGKGSSKYPFMRTAAYASLRPHLATKFVEQLEGEAITVNVHKRADGGLSVIGNFPHKMLIEEIDRIERKWDLI